MGNWVNECNRLITTIKDSSKLLLLRHKCNKPRVLFQVIQLSVIFKERIISPGYCLGIENARITQPQSWSSHYSHNHRTTAKAFSSEEYFTLYWKEIGIGVAWTFGLDLL